MTFISIICTALMCMFSHVVAAPITFFLFNCPNKNPPKTIFFMFHHISRLRRSVGLERSRCTLSVIGLLGQEATGFFFLSSGHRAFSTCFYVTDNTPAPPTDVGQPFRSPPSRNASAVTATASRWRNKIDFVIPTPFKEHSRIMVAV